MRLPVAVHCADVAPVPVEVKRPGVAAVDERGKEAMPEVLCALAAGELAQRVQEHPCAVDEDLRGHEVARRLFGLVRKRRRTSVTRTLDDAEAVGLLRGDAGRDHGQRS